MGFGRRSMQDAGGLEIQYFPAGLGEHPRLTNEGRALGCGVRSRCAGMLRERLRPDEKDTACDAGGSFCVSSLTAKPVPF